MEGWTMETGIHGKGDNDPSILKPFAVRRGVAEARLSLGRDRHVLYKRRNHGIFGAGMSGTFLIK